MRFTIYTSVAAFAEEVIPALNKHEIQNNLLLGNIYGALGQEGPTDLFMATVKDDAGKLLLTAVQTPPHPMVAYETDNTRNDDAVDFFAAALVTGGISLDFIMTEKALAKKLTDTYGKLTGKSFYCHENLVLYLLEKVNNLPLPKGTFRAAGEADMYYLPYWYADFVPACHLGEYDLNAGIGKAQRSIVDNSAFIWEDETPVSTAATARRTSDCAFINQVYAPPQLRGRGYSTACVSKLSQKLFEDGFKYCALYADCANPYSNKVYISIGYKEIFYYDQYKLKESNQDG